jgi:hypothetical protein
MANFGIFRGFSEKLYEGELPVSLGKIGSTEVSDIIPEYQAILNYATTQGYTLPSLNQQVKQNQLLSDLVFYGIWDKLDTFAVFATDAEDSLGSGTSNFALIDWKRLSQLTAVNSPTFTTNQGFTGNGSSSYLNTNFQPLTNKVNISLNSASFGAYFYSNAIQDKGFGAIGFYLNPTTATVSGVSLIRSIFIGPGVNGGIHSGRQGFFQVNRKNSTEVNHIKNGTDLGAFLSNSNSIINTNLYLLAYNTGEFATDQISMYFAGSSLYDERLNFSNSWNTYINSI